MNAYKYCYRAGLKDGNDGERDIDKAKWYLEHYDKLTRISEENITYVEISKRNEIVDMIEEYHSKTSTNEYTLEELKAKINEQSRLIDYLEKRYDALSKENDYIMKKYTESVKNDG
jgi:uncharacterized coiled-coil protein SlyX